MDDGVSSTLELGYGICYSDGVRVVFIRSLLRSFGIPYAPLL